MVAVQPPVSQGAAGQVGGFRDAGEGPLPPPAQGYSRAAGGANGLPAGTPDAGKGAPEVPPGGVVDHPVMITNPDAGPCLAHRAAIGVLAVPDEGVALVGLGGKALPECFTRHFDGEADPAQAGGHGIGGEGDGQGACGLVAGHAFALVVQVERGAGDGQFFSQGLALGLDDAAGFTILIFVRRRIVGWRRRGWRLGIRRRTPGPVVVPGGEVGDGGAPEALAGRMEFGQARTLGVADAEVGQGLGVGGVAAAVHVQLGHAVSDGEDADDPAVVGRYPGGLFPVVPAGRHDFAHREIEEVVDVDRHGLVEIDPCGAGGDGFVDGEFDGVGVGAGGGQLAGHGPGAVVADGVFGGAHVEGGEGLGAAAGQGEGGGGAPGEQQGGLAGAVGVGDGAALCDLEGLGGVGKVDGGDL